MKQDIAEIAGKLTKAQRDMLLSVPLRPLKPTRWTSDSNELAVAREMPTLLSAGLAATTGAGFAALLAPTQLGREVIAHLLAHSHPEKQA